MFSVRQKREIADKVQAILRETAHLELPCGEIQFRLHVGGAEPWSWADIQNNGAVKEPEANPWNEAQDMTTPNGKREFEAATKRMEAWKKDADQWWSEDDEAVATITAALKDYEKVKGELERLDYRAKMAEKGWMLDMERLKEQQASAEKAESKLERFRPLIEAAEEFRAIEGDEPRAMVARMKATNKILDAAIAAIPEGKP